MGKNKNVSNEHYDSIWQLVHELETMLLDKGVEIKTLDELRKEILKK